ncbi:MAG TPA: two-component system response regulator [Blastocatellia bacterium]|nr:two-component system response regulator [Blastocatellia bacterium]
MSRHLSALVVDDEPQLLELIAEVLDEKGWSVEKASTGEEAIGLIGEKNFDLVFCDVMLGAADGYDVLRRFTEVQPLAKVVLMTGRGSAAGALEATSIGAFDYLLKPFSVEDINRLADLACSQIKLRDQESGSPAEAGEQLYASEIPLIGRSPKFVECLKMVGRVAASDLPVLVTGESGTGKEIVASAIHQRSKRRGGPFVVVNCGAIPVELIESELFGHVKGSFTGASGDRVGLWEQADGGTIFLDEVTETSPLFQVKLLRTLQLGEIRRVGSNRTIKIDARVIAATNRNIEAEVADGRFRQDLMYRLNAVTICLPPLRERVEDIQLLAEHFASAAGRSGAPVIRFSAAALELMKRYSWPGNVRELENAVLHAASMTDDVVYPDHLPERIREFDREMFSAESNGDPSSSSNSNGPLAPLADIEAAYVAKVLAHTGGNKQAAARILQIDRKTLTRILARNGE